MAKIIESFGTIKHLNIRKEGSTDDKVLGIDIKLVDCPCDLKFLARVLGNEYEHVVEQSFWDHEGNKRFLALEPISSCANYDECGVAVEGLRFADCKVSKFKVTLLSNREATVDLQISVNDPTSNSVAILAELVSDEVRFKVTRAQQEMDFGGDVNQGERSDDDAVEDDLELDPLLNAAAALVIETQKVSTSMIQRHCKIGYNRAARILEQLESLRMISAPGTDGRRSVLAESNAYTVEGNKL